MQTSHVTHGDRRAHSLLGSVLALVVAGCGAAASPDAATAAFESASEPSAGAAATAQPTDPADLKKGVVVTMAPEAPTTQPEATGSAHATEGLDDAASTPTPPPPPRKGVVPPKTKASASKPSDSKPGGTAAPQQASAASLGHQLSGDDVDAAIGPKLRELRACAKLDSSVSIHLSIAPGGKVSESSATRSTPDDPALRDCVASVLRSVAFQAASDARGTALSFELALKPLEMP